MKASEQREEIRSMSDDELVERLAEEKDNLFKLRFKRVTGQLEDVSQLRKAKRAIARVNTELRTREIAAAEGNGR
jgi:large subunit ribosomal protein L29